MNLLVVNVFCAAFILVSGGYGVIAFPPEPDPVTKPSPTPTTTPKITTSSKPPTTTSPSPTTTPITTVSTPTPTSPTTTVGPTTTIKPTPAPTPQIGEWVVNGTNKTCVIVRMSAQFNVTYLSEKNETRSKLIILPSANLSSVVTGICGENEQVINIAWGLNTTQNDSLKLHFVKNGTKDYSLHHIELYLGLGELPSVNTNNTVMLIHNMSEYKTGLGNSYRCAKFQRIALISNVTNTTGQLQITDLQFQAFRNEKTTIFGLAEDCAVETQDIVPIAVGCALIALVVIVLVAYLVGRRRRQAGGYTSM